MLLCLVEVEKKTRCKKKDEDKEGGMGKQVLTPHGFYLLIFILYIFILLHVSRMLIDNFPNEKRKGMASNMCEFALGQSGLSHGGNDCTADTGPILGVISFLNDTRHEKKNPS